MIKINKNNFNRALKAFRKGKTYWLAKSQDKLNDFRAIISIAWMKKVSSNKLEMEYNRYDILRSEFYRKFVTFFDGWNFDNFDFFILNKKEVSPYIKQMIVAELEK